MRSFLILVFAVSFYYQGISQHISKEKLKPLNFLVGNWKVEVDARLSRNGPWEKSEATSTIKKAIGETIFEEEYKGTKEGRILTAKAWLGNDNRTKLYQRIWVDSDHGVLMVQEGELKDKTLTLQSVLDLNGTRLVLRIQYIFNGNDSFTVESSRSTDDGKTWDRTGTSKYSRTVLQ